MQATAARQTRRITRPLPEGYEFSTGPTGAVSIHCKDEPGFFYSLAAWVQIEQGRGLWKDAHAAIFGRAAS